MYDKDGNGSVDLEEMVEIIGTLYDMEGASKVSERCTCSWFDPQVRVSLSNDFLTCPCPSF